jgi:hypothetical protein
MKQTALKDAPNPIGCPLSAGGLPLRRKFADNAKWLAVNDLYVNRADDAVRSLRGWSASGSRQQWPAANRPRWCR